MRNNIVLDTNTIISALLFPSSIVGKAFDKAQAHFQIVASEKTWAEVNIVIHRQKFDKYVILNARLLFLEDLHKSLIFIEPTEVITDCRDPKDNKFLELAIASDSPFIITGDAALLVLNPYRGVTILKSGDFLALELLEY